jgi:hypothetical protein
MVKFALPSKGAHPYTHEITKKEHDEFVDFLKKESDLKLIYGTGE